MTFEPTVVNIAIIKVNAMDRRAGLHFSKNYLQNRFAQTAKNQGFGENNGDRNHFCHTGFLVNDDDLFDSQAFNKD